MTQKLTIIGHRTAFNNEQSPYRIVSCKMPRNNNAKQFKQEIYRPFLCIKRNKYVTHQQTTTTELQAPDLGQAHKSFSND